MQLSSAHDHPATQTPIHAGSGAVMGGVKLLLRAEGAAVLGAALYAYAQYGAGWGTFGWYFLAPDLAFLAYLGGPRLGALAYNTTHSYVGAAGVLGVGLWLSLPVLWTVALIWFAHIGMDRALGYGLKYSAGFGHTHLGLVGRAKHDA